MPSTSLKLVGALFLLFWSTHTNPKLLFANASPADQNDTTAATPGIIQPLQQTQQKSSSSSSPLLFGGVPRPFSTTTTTTTMTDDAVATQTNGDGTLDASAFTYDDPEAFASISHPGYTMDSDPETFLGGWLAHRKVLQEEVTDENGETTKHKDWIQDDGVAEMMTRYDYETMPIGRAPRLLVLYGSLRETSYSRKMAYEFARLLEVLGCDVRVYNPRGLPVRDPVLDKNVKVQELRALTQWSDGHVWVSPEMHGTVTGVFKNQIDWIPLNTGSVRPTQGKTCLVAQVNGGSQSFNAVNYLRLLARWMRMPCCTNQSSVAKAWKEFDDENGGRMKPSSFRDRVVDCAEEFAKFNALVRGPHADELTNRYSERKEKEEKGRLLTQAEKEAEKDKNATITNSRKA